MADDAFLFQFFERELCFCQVDVVDTVLSNSRDITHFLPHRYCTIPHLTRTTSCIDYTMSESDSEYEYSAEVYIQKRIMLRRSGKAFSTDIDSAEEYEKVEPLCFDVYNGAAQLRVICTGRRDTFEGQMGMVDFGDGVACPVTCLHNVVQRLGVKPIASTCTFDGPRYNETFQVNIQHTGIPISRISQFVLQVSGFQTSWLYGVDITTGVFPDESPHLRGFHVFQAVEEGFEYAVGTKVAMAVFAKQAANKDSAKMSQVSDTVSPAQVYGGADEINIYTGTITGIGQRHFEHNMNSYRGCSGAIVFLLEGPSARCAVGVHIGSPEDIPHKVNLAIKIREAPTFLPRSPTA